MYFFATLSLLENRYERNLFGSQGMNLVRHQKREEATKKGVKNEVEERDSWWW